MAERRPSAAAVRCRQTTADSAGPGPTGPLRRCLATGAVRPKEGLVRFVIGPGARVVPDVDGRLPGRGFWLSPTRDVVNTACAKGLFARAARAAVAADADLADQVETLLARRCLDLIGLARRAGQAVAGFEKVQGWLRAGKAGVVLAATDGAAGGRAKVRAPDPDTPRLELFSAAEQGAALGRERAVHVAVAPGRLAERLRLEAARLAGFRSQDRSGRGSPVDKR